MEGEDEDRPPIPRRRSSLTAQKRMSLHLRRLSDDPEIQEERRRSLAAGLPSAVSMRSVKVEEPVSN